MTLRLSSLNQRNKFKERLSPPQVGIATTFGNYGSAVGKWNGAALAPNGNVYVAPFNEISILKIDPIVGTASTIPIVGLGTNAHYRGMVCGKNGKLYCIPSGVYNNNRVLEFDPQYNSYKFFSEVITDDFFGGVLAPNGKIYGIPFQVTTNPTILEIDPVVGIATTFSSVPAGRYVGGVLGPNGKIYCIPYSATTVLEIDPNTKTTSTFGSLSAGSKWAGGVLANNGKIYGAPYGVSSIVEIDPISRTVSTFGESSDVWSVTDPGWAYPQLGSDGKIYAFPVNSGNFSYSVLKIDPDNKTLSLIYPEITNYDVGGAVAARNGKIYSTPSEASSIIAIGISAANKSPQWITKPHEVSPRCGFTTVLSDVGVSTSVYQYLSGCLGNDGNIYAIPYGGLYNDTSKIIKINPNKETYELKTTIPDNYDAYYNWGPSISATIQLKNGKICGVPYARPYVIFYDPKSDATNEVLIYNRPNINPSNGKGETTYTWISGSLAPNGKIYCPPAQGNRILVINTNTESVSINDFSPIGISTSYYYGITDANWGGSVLAPNGKIYAVPQRETSVLEIDPVVGTATTFGSLGTSAAKWWGAVLAPNGKIYGIPNTATTILEIDPVSRTATTFGDISTFLSAGQHSYEASLGADGKIYILPNNHTKIIQLDPETKTLSLYKTLPQNFSTFSGVLAPNGNLYCIPCGWYASPTYTQAKLVSIGTTQKYEQANWLLSSYTNKSV